MNDLFGNAAASLAADAAAAPPQGGIQQLILPMLLVGFAFYFIILRPQKRDQQKVKDMRDSIKKGDRVKSIGGIHGTVTAVDTTRNIVTVQVDRNVKLDFDREAISTVTRKEDAVAEVDTKPEVAAPEAKQ